MRIIKLVTVIATLCITAALSYAAGIRWLAMLQDHSVSNFIVTIIGTMIIGFIFFMVLNINRFANYVEDYFILRKRR